MILSALALCAASTFVDDEALLSRVEHHHAENDGVRLHYVTLGQGDPVLLVHGFPDYWYTWRGLMTALEDRCELAAMDLRGYNQSDQPEEVAAYAMPKLVGDVLAVARHWGKEKITLVGHDWGAGIAWQVAMARPDLVERLVILSVPHPSGFGRELRTNEAQREDSQYARDFQRADAASKLSAEGLAGWVKDEAARAHYLEAFRRSSFEGMLNYYKASYPSSAPPPPGASPPPPPSFPKIRAPVLVLHGMQDRALHASGHAHCWDWIEGDTTLLMIPDAGHFLQHDRPEMFAATVRQWLELRPLERGDD